MRKWVLVAACLMLGGCFESTANSEFQTNGAAKVDVEFAISMQFAAMVAGLAKEDKDAGLLGKCENSSTDGATLPAGVRLIKLVRGNRGDMLTCTAYLEVQDPVKAAQSWKPKEIAEDGTLDLREFRLEQLNKGSYRLAALLQANPPKPDKSTEANPFAAMFAAAMMNHFITVSISATRIENATGELSNDRRRVTWKLPITMLMTPPVGYKQEIRADIIYSDESWPDRLWRSVGLGPSSPAPSTVAPSAEAAPTVDADKEKKRLAAEAAAAVDAEKEKKRLAVRLATYQDELEKAKATLSEIQAEIETAARLQVDQQTLVESIVISKARFSYQKSTFREEPTISFSIVNKSSVPVKRIFVEGILQTPGRAIPWLKDSFSYEFKGGLEPTESQDLNLAPNMFGEWGKVPKEAVGGAVLTLKLKYFEDASGTKIGGDAKGGDGAVTRKKALEGTIQELEAKIAEVQKQLR